MNAVIAWFAQNRVAANLLMVTILVAGALSMHTIKREVFPNVPLNIISISIPYPGASPQQVESAVVAPVERALRSIDSVMNIKSLANQHLGLVSVQAEDGVNRGAFYEDVRSAVNAVRFPANVEQPLFRDLAVELAVGQVTISGDADERTLRTIANRVKNDLLDLDAISNGT